MSQAKKELTIKREFKLLKILVLWFFSAVFAVQLCFAGSPWHTRVSTGYFASVGDYGGDEDTNLAALPTSIRVRNDTWGVKLTVPWVQVDGPGNLHSGELAGGQKNDSQLIKSEIDRREGLGDVTLDLLYSWRWGAWFADGTFRTKFPTADEDEGLGTGATDYETRIDLARRWNRWTGFGHAAYRLRGEKQGDDLRNTPAASLGAQRPVSFGDATDDVRYQMGGFVEVRRAARDQRPLLKDMFVYLSIQVASRWRGSIMTSRGFSDSSPRWGVGTQIAYEF